MKIIDQLTMFIYSFAKKSFSPKLFNWMGGSKILSPFRNLFLRNKQLPRIVGDWINFENLSFYFEAPIKVFNHAKATGLEARISRTAMAQLKPGSVAIDVGANYGFITLIMAKSVQPNGKVITFEPINHINNVLLSNITKNELEETCLIIDKFAGLLGSDGFISVDEVLTAYNIEKVDFIKIDVDGGDFEVLLGAKELLSNHHPVLVVEMSSKQYEILDYLKDIGYLFFIGMDGEAVIPPDFPPNLFASITPIQIPARDFFT